MTGEQISNPHWLDVDEAIARAELEVTKHGIENITAFVIIYRGQGADNFGFEAIGDPHHAVLGAIEFLGRAALMAGIKGLNKKTIGDVAVEVASLLDNAMHRAHDDA